MKMNKTYIDYFKNKGVQGINGNSSWEQLCEKVSEKFGMTFSLYKHCIKHGDKTTITIYKGDDVCDVFERDNNEVWDYKECYWQINDMYKFFLSYLMSTNCGKRKTKKFDKYKKC